MNSRTIDGHDIRNWFQFGFREVEQNKKQINAINVFPVADGDTGTNLTLTLKAMSDWPTATRSFGKMLEKISESGLAHARGNSGIIFASYINGLASEGKLYETIGVSEFSSAAHNAVEYIYKAVEKPVEGTMISVIRDWAYFLSTNNHKFQFFEDLLAEAYKVARASLGKTTETLEVLRKNHVVDAGGEGFVRFLKGINGVFSQEKAQVPDVDLTQNAPSIIEEYDSSYRYCTEFLVQHSGLISHELHRKLEELGDSFIISYLPDKFRIHIHTNYPQQVRKLLKEEGEVLEQKVDDMKLQNEVLFHQKSKVALLTDSIADLPDYLVMHHQIHTIPLTILFDEELYLDKNTINLKGLFAEIEASPSYPTSSQPEVGRVRERLEYLCEHYDSIIIISVAEKLSGTFSVFKKEAERLEQSGKKVTVIDSRLNSGAQGLLVKKAAELLEAGASHDDIVEEVLSLIPKTKIYVCLETIENAVRGGRVPNTVGKLGIAIGARPIMTLDENGKGAAFGVGFSQDGMTKKIFTLLRKIKSQKGIQSYSIVHAENPQLAKAYEERLEKLLGYKPDFVTEISSVTAIHSGRGCVAVSLIEQ